MTDDERPGDEDPTGTASTDPAKPDADNPPIDASATTPPDQPPAIRRPSAETELRLPAALYAFLVVQVAASLLVGYALLALARAPRTAAIAPTATPPSVATTDRPLRAPTLDLPAEETVHGLRFSLSGAAPNGEVAALLADGKVVAVERIIDGRFVFRDVELPAAIYQISVVAYQRAGSSIESTPAELTLVPAEVTPLSRSQRTTTPTPTPSPAKRADRGAPITPALRPADLLAPNPPNIVRGLDARRMALTFDGGSNSSEATAVLDALSASGVHSTLFLTGDFIDNFPEVTRRIVRDGHEVGNHTLDHPHLADWSGKGHHTRNGVTREFLVGQLRATEQRFLAATGKTMTRYWRAPYGEINREILGWAADEGWTHIGWTQGFDTLDWVADPNDRLYQSAAEIRDKLLRHARTGESARGGIVLMHLGAEREHDQAAGELPRIIDGLRREGYELVTISKLLGT